MKANLKELFTLKPHEYRRNMHIVKEAFNDYAFYISKMVDGKATIPEVVDWLKEQTSEEGPNPLLNPEVLFLERDKHGDREKFTTTFEDYLNNIIENEYIAAPTLTVYNNQNQKQSMLSMCVKDGVEKRNIAKKAAHEYKMRGNLLLAAFKEIEQTSRKLGNNALSGAQVDKGTPLNNKSAHSSLTSTCRGATSYSNANNEKFITGNRHYWSYEIVKANICSICRSVDLPLMTEVMTEYNLHYPTVDETMDCITYSTKLYLPEENEELDDIRLLVSKLTAMERAFFVYCGDFYHLKKHNEEFVREYVDRLSQKSTDASLEDPDTIINNVDKDTVTFVSLLCSQEIKGRLLKDIKTEDPEAYKTVAATVLSIKDHLFKYAKLYRVFWVTDNIPASVYNLPQSIRRCAVLSDTDSTVFTVEHWAEWFTGSTVLTEKAYNVAYGLVYLASQTIIHILGHMSANIGLLPEYVHQIEMKNEYFFPLLAITGRAKHYYSYVSAKEGNVYKELEFDVKGVGLRNSARAVEITSGMHTYIKSLMDDILVGKPINARDVLDHIGNLERKIINSVMAGDPEFLSMDSIKNTYKNVDNPKHKQYNLWEKVFAPKYGNAPPTPISVVKVPLTTDKHSLMNQWLDDLEDQELAERMRVWLDANKKSRELTNILLPMNYTVSHGIPEELRAIVDIRRLIMGIMDGYYLFLESLGFHFIDKNITRLVSDYYGTDNVLKALQFQADQNAALASST